MAKINIYVPDGLKNRMQRRDDKEVPINWSNFFQQCVEAMLEVEEKAAARGRK